MRQGGTVSRTRRERAFVPHRVRTRRQLRGLGAGGCRARGRAAGRDAADHAARRFDHAGHPAHPSYRRLLWQQLQQGGYNVDFVGSMTTYYDGLNGPTDFDLDHEGHGGWRADALLAQAAAWTAAARPDIVLLPAGTNDVLNDESPASTIDEIGQTIDAIRTANPDVVVLLALIIPVNIDHQVMWNIDAINAGLPALAASKSTGARRCRSSTRRPGSTRSPTRSTGSTPTRAARPRWLHGGTPACQR